MIQCYCKARAKFFLNREINTILCLKKNTLNFLLLSFSTKEEDNIQNFKGRSKFTRVPKLCPPPPFFFKVNQQFLLNIVRKYFLDWFLKDIY